MIINIIINIIIIALKGDQLALVIEAVGSPPANLIARFEIYLIELSLDIHFNESSFDGILIYPSKYLSQPFQLKLDVKHIKQGR